MPESPADFPAIDVALAIVIRANQVLVTQRRHDVHLPNLWEFPGGKLEPGEDVQTAALRELFEETGVRAAAIESLPSVRWRFEDRSVVLHPLVCIWRQHEPQPLHCVACRWMAPTALLSLDTPDSNRRIVTEFLERLPAIRSRHDQ